MLYHLLNTITICLIQVASKDTPGEDAGPLCQICFVGETGGSERARKMLPCKSCGKKYHRSCLKTWARHRGKTHWVKNTEGCCFFVYSHRLIDGRFISLEFVDLSILPNLRGTY
jgi:hypothetical protein